MALAAIPVAAAAVFLSVSPIAQRIEYHLFADIRAFCGVPNFGDVSTNFTFLLAGGLGLWEVLRRPPDAARTAWVVMFTGVALVSVGSAYYHWAPSNETLVWDRLPMTIGFTALAVAVLSEFVSPRLERYLLWPAVLIGGSSVFYWEAVDDLRFYYWVQAVCITSVLAAIAIFGKRRPDGRAPYIFIAALLYGLAIVFEQADRAVFDLLGGAISGHSIKHMVAASAIFVFYLRLCRGAARV